MSWEKFKETTVEWLEEWHQVGKQGHRALNDTAIPLQERSDALGAFATKYGIARTFPKRYDVEKMKPRYEPVIRVLDRTSPLDANSSLESVVRKIIRVQNSICPLYGKKSLLSPTSKFLWLKFQRPFLVYDSKARTALGIGGDSNRGKLLSFFEAWHDAYKKRRSTIEKICAALGDTPIVHEPWFHERAFDFYMWKTEKLP